MLIITDPVPDPGGPKTSGSGPSSGPGYGTVIPVLIDNVSNNYNTYIVYLLESWLMIPIDLIRAFRVSSHISPVVSLEAFDIRTVLYLKGNGNQCV